MDEYAGAINYTYQVMEINDKEHSTNQSNHFLALLLELLQSHPLGLSEFELIKRLECEGEETFARANRQNNLSLFQMHFFLFHHLYLLQSQLYQAQKYLLEINPLRIALRELSPTSSTMLDAHDPLRDYYLDLENLTRATAADVDDLLHQFWRKLLVKDKRSEALTVLELQDPVDWKTIKAQYRRLAMKHHPDRGGDSKQLQLINAAIEILKSDHI